MDGSAERIGQFSTIEQAIEEFKAGRILIVVDDEDRENEGDFVCAAEFVDPGVINFLATHGRGIICAPILEGRAAALGLDLMVDSNTSLHETPFTVSVDFVHGTTTGVSAADRAATVRALADEKTSRPTSRARAMSSRSARWTAACSAGRGTRKPSSICADSRASRPRGFSARS